MARIAKLALLVGMLLLGWSLVNGDDQVPAVKSAEVVVPETDPLPLEVNENWRKAPDYLARATIYFNAQPATSVLNFKVTEPGLVVMAASFSYDGNQIDQPWTKDCKRFAELRDDGWTPIGVLNSPKTSRHYLFRRIVKAGEEFHIQTRFHYPPYLILVPDADVAKVLEVNPWVGPERNTPMVLKDEEGEPKGRSATATPQVVSFRFHDPVQSVLDMRFGILLREIVQQGVSLAASEQMGLPTNDTSFGFSLQDDSQPGLGALKVVAIGQPLNSMDLAIFRQNGKKWEAMWDEDLRLPAENFYENLTARVEKLSRNEFVDVLHRCGYDGVKPPAARETAELPDGAETLLSKLSMPAQFGAVRALVAEMRKNGESPELVGAVARGYAMLGVLTEELWSAAHKVFKARAMLYAERGVQAWPKSALALENRAYVRALIGLHRTALDDLAAAAELHKANADGGKGTASAPIWTKAIEAFCKFDADALEAASKDEANANLARLLQEMAAEYSQSERDIIQASGELLQAAPDCLRAVDGATKVKQIGYFRGMIAYGAKMTERELLKQVRDIPDLPADAAKLIDELQKSRGSSALGKLFGAKPVDEMPVRLQVIEALRQAGKPEHDTAELSWQVLAQLLAEIDFLQAWWKVDAAAYWLGWNPDETIEAVMPQVEHHPYADFLVSFSSDPEKSRSAAESLAKKIDPATLQFSSEVRMLTRINTFVRDWWITRWPIGFCNEDCIAPDLCVVMNNAKEPKLCTLHLQQSSPYLPLGVASAITNGVGDSMGKAAELEARYTKSSAVQLALAKQFEKQKLWDDAIRCYRAAIKADPSYTNYFLLAGMYQLKGDDDNWLTTVEEYLKTEDYGLGHARAEVKIADYYIKKRDWKSARKYADEAAQSWAGWALLKAAQCAEAMQDWSAAEQWYAAESQRYQDCPSQWYEFCKRTGQGDEQKALDAMGPYLQRAEKSNVDALLQEAGVIRAVTRQPQEAANDFEKSFGINSGCAAATYAALLYDELNDTKSRDRILERVLEHRDGYDKCEQIQAWLMLIETMRTNWAKEDPKKIEIESLEKIVVKAPAEQRSELYYWAGKYLDRLGRTDEGIGYWKRSMASGTGMNGLARTMAGAELWEHGVAPSAYKDAVMGSEKVNATDKGPEEAKE